MKLICCKDYEDMSRLVAEDILREVADDPEIVLGLATGSTPEGCYKHMIEACEAGEADFSQVTTINLDEYKGLAPEDPQSYRYFMNSHLFDYINIDKSKTFVPDGLEEDAEKACSDYEAIVEEHEGIDVQLLGLGGNGHIGFNEPGEFFIKDTHCVDLTQGTIEANARFFDSIDDVPKQAYSMGIGNILNAEKVILAVSGIKKAQALYDVIYGGITPMVQGSILQLHRNVVIYADEDSLSLIKEKGLL